MITSKNIKSIYLTLVIFVTLCFYPVPVKAFDLFLGTGEQGTFSHYSGRVLARVINHQIKDINCRTLSGSGDIHNLTNLLQGSLDIALIDSRMLDNAINKKGNFKFLDINYQNLSILTPLYDVPITLVAGKNSNIKKLEDLKGRRINIGSPGSPQNFFFNSILKAKGWSKKDFSLVAQISDSQSQDALVFCYGDIDAMLHIGVHPDPSLQQLFKLCKGKIIDMDDNDISNLIHQNQALSKFTLPAGTYPSPFQTKDITSFSTQILVVGSQDLDEKIVYTILDAIYTNDERFSSAHPALALTKLEEMNQTKIKLHSGALKYLNDQK